MTPKSAAPKGPSKPTAPKARKTTYDPDSIPKWSGGLTRREWGVYASLRSQGDLEVAKAYREQLRATRLDIKVVAKTPARKEQNYPGRSG
jgi:hypothetical protein